MAEHRFGGTWTQEKLRVLEAYLGFYLTALKNQPFRLHYADAFAGTGRYITSDQSSGQLMMPDQMVVEDLKGSVLTALDIEPGFDEYHFNDIKPAHVAELNRIRNQYPDKLIQISRLDANEFVRGFCRDLEKSDRAILFLDPYSTQLDWETLKPVADSGKIDLWLLFPLSVILRMTPKQGASIREEWRSTLDRLLGTNEWEQALYIKQADCGITDLFDMPGEEQSERLNWQELQNWVTGRLKELFQFVAKPYLLTSHGRPLFLFYFAVSNRSPNAWGLAQRAANHIIQKYSGR